MLARHIAGLELRRDIGLIEAVAAAPSTLDGMRLTRFDQALIHNRKLLRTLYWRADAMPAPMLREVAPRRSAQ